MTSSRGLGDDVGRALAQRLDRTEKHIENGRDLLPHVPVSLPPSFG
jgi:hypothetical protein